MSDRPRDVRSRATAVLAAFAAAFVAIVALGAFFAEEVQTVSAEELVARRDDARAFLYADLVFIALYAVVLPIALWRFRTVASSRWPTLAAIVLALAGAVDLTENVLLISATDSVSAGAVDAAHALEVPKIGLFVAGLLATIVSIVLAVRLLRSRRSHQTSPSRQSHASTPDSSSDTPAGNR